MHTPSDPKQVFLDVLELPAAEHAAFLDAACGGDAALRERVEALLAADQRAGTFLTAPTQGAGEGGAPQEQPSTVIGNFELQQQIGEGGFGTVWMAEQQRPVRRQVALKVIKRGMDTRSVVARFEQERQALALMDHPNIAKVFDGGETPAGRPYFAMELVSGLPVTQFCDQQRLDAKGRLALFVSVCHAVQHAHQKGIIHRDLKPSNVLVTLQDGVPVPKVIDFGVAKAVHRPLRETTLLTELQQMVGTPEYMAPEQAELSGIDIDTRADIYSLGVLLYELLTGTLPFDLRTREQKGLLELLRVIREDEPQKPSTRVSTPGESSTEAARRRRTDPRRLGRLLRGDLDWIVMKALEKDRARRYVSADAFAADVERHLRDEPVEAGPPGRVYRLQKYVRRHRVGVIAGAAVATALLAGLSAAVWGFVEARAERDIAEAQRDKAERIAEFMSKTLQGAGPSVALGRDIKMLREMMDAAAARIERGELKDAPEAELKLRGTIGGTYRELAAYDNAAKMLEPALELARSLHEGDHEAKGDALNNLALLRQTRGDLPGAEKLYREFVEMCRRLHPGDDLNLATSLENLGGLLWRRRVFAEAETLCREALEMKQRLMPGDHESVATSLNTLGLLLRARGDLRGGLRLVRSALEMHRHCLPGDHPTVATGLDNLGSILTDLGNLSGAERFCREALEMKQRLYQGDHPEVAGSLNNLASVLRARSDLAGAEARYREALGMVRRLFPGDNESVALGLSNLAGLLEIRGDLPGAELLCREALEMRQRLLPRDHESVATSLNNLGLLLRARGDHPEAERLTRRALEMCRRCFPGDHPTVAAGINNLASMLEDRGNLLEAEPLCREALDMVKRIYQGDHRHVATGLGTLAGVLKARGDLAGAEAHYREALEMWKRLFTGDHPDVATGLTNLAFVLRARGDLAGAEPLCREALEMDRRLFPGDHAAVAIVLSNLAFVLHARGDLAGAEPLCREALEMKRRLFIGDHATVANSLNNLAGLLEARGDLAGAEQLFREALEMHRRCSDGAHPNVANSLRNLAGVLCDRGNLAGAEEHYREAAAMYDRLPGAGDHDKARARLGLGMTLGRLRRFVEAEPELLAAETVVSEAKGLPAGQHKKCLEALVEFYESWNQAEPGKGYDAKAAQWKTAVQEQK